jgi:hypothetical protein
MKEYVELLMKKAAEDFASENAMRFSQAACNVANAMSTLDSMKRDRPGVTAFGPIKDGGTT